MKLNKLKKKVNKTKKTPTIAQLAGAILIDPNELKEIKYHNRGCFISICHNKVEQIETCRETARYNYNDYLRESTFFMGFYHPVKNGMTLFEFLSQFDDFFKVKNNFFDLSNGIAALHIKDNFWLKSDVNFEVLTLLVRSFNIIGDPRVTSLEQWASRVVGKDLLDDDVVEFIVNFKKLSSTFDFDSYIDFDWFDGLVNFIQNEDDSCSFRSLLLENLSVKDLIKIYVR